MSKCEHNDHGHSTLYLFFWTVFVLSITTNFINHHQNEELKQEVHDLENKVHLLQEKSYR